MSIGTLALTLRSTPEQTTALADVQAAFSAACNGVRAVAWEQQEFRQPELQELVYRYAARRAHDWKKASQGTRTTRHSGPWLSCPRDRRASPRPRVVAVGA